MSESPSLLDESTEYRTTNGQSGPTELGARYHLRGEGVTEVAMIDGNQVVLETVNPTEYREYVLPMEMVPSVECQRVD